MRNGNECRDGAQRALDYVLGSLGDPERSAFETHLGACGSCRDEVRSLEPIVVELRHDQSEGPSPAVWDRILTRVRADGASIAQPWKGWSDHAPGSLGAVVLGDAQEWEPTEHAGISACRLSVDRQADRVTMLVRMEAGSSYPAHVHGGAEECFVIAGDLQVGPDLCMRVGDYQRCPPGSRHPVQSTRDGCTLFLVSSLQDEIVSGA